MTSVERPCGGGSLPPLAGRNKSRPLAPPEDASNTHVSPDTRLMAATTAHGDCARIPRERGARDASRMAAACHRPAGNRRKRRPLTLTAAGRATPPRCLRPLALAMTASVRAVAGGAVREFNTRRSGRAPDMLARNPNNRSPSACDGPAAGPARQEPVALAGQAVRVQEALQPRTRAFFQWLSRLGRLEAVPSLPSSTPKSTRSEPTLARPWRW